MLSCVFAKLAQKQLQSAQIAIEVLLSPCCCQVLVVSPPRAITVEEAE